MARFSYSISSWENATSNTTMNAVRKLANPLADVTALDNLVQGVITNNPFQCVSYNAQGMNHRQLNAAGRITPHESSTRT